MRLISISILATAVLVAGCSFPGVHKNPIEQGNQLIPERVERVEIGMTRDQVRFLLGSPITVNTFNPNRWIYLERIDFDGEIRENTYFIVNFTDDRVAEIQRETGGSPSDPLSKVDTTRPDPQDAESWWWPF
jgi:outer membrane protein assembly factor BamE